MFHDLTLAVITLESNCFIANLRQQQIPQTGHKLRKIYSISQEIQNEVMKQQYKHDEKRIALKITRRKNVHVFLPQTCSSFGSR